MKYLLVLQFTGDNIDTLDNIVTLEDQLIKYLGSAATVDGHDIGCGQANIFIYTAEPANTFETVRQVLAQAHLLETTTAAYRETEGENYIVIWHEGAKHNFKIK